MEVEPVFDFHPGGDLEDDVVDIEELKLQGNPNLAVTTLADVVNVEDDTVDKVNQVRGKTKKRKLPPKTPKGPKPQKNRSPAWDHFEKIKEGDETWGVCNYCKKRYAADSKKHGVSNLKAHIPACLLYPLRDKNGQPNLSFKVNERGGGGVDVVASVFSFTECKRALAEMVIIDELPFRFVEGIGFRKFCKVMQPKFAPVPSRQTITREVVAIKDYEKGKLKKLLKGRRICLTTDTWTSIQNLNYMCLTAHFIDDDWKLQKRILNFCQIEDHKGGTIGKKIESLLLDWNVDGIFTMTVDNASSNATAIEHLKRKTMDWKRTVLGHEYIHMRCCAHILNLIVVEGLKDMSESILHVRDVVRYVRSSPQRMETFKKCVEKEKIKSKQTVCLDVCTRWNSTYLMLDIAINFEKAFQRMGEEDNSFIKFFGIKEGEEDLSLEGDQCGSHSHRVSTQR
ncbi:hypothetical protein RHMOL_Rhmol08G0258200 [Rhododendron molle]|uniref:Uncharacterized protein n=1 Tax=Rhododendron molle TaxID=49168 RepID=A0ACC0MTJ1_RHOML|nr:hypothetical protein RHMOL_Rhmol08G0258200 [Rhododendron molle]